MKILVCIKQVPDTGAIIPISADKKGIDESGLEWIISPYDEFALEEALQIKEKKGGKRSYGFKSWPFARGKSPSSGAGLRGGQSCFDRKRK